MKVSDTSTRSSPISARAWTCSSGPSRWCARRWSAARWERSRLASAWPDVVARSCTSSPEAHLRVTELRERLAGIPFHAALKQVLTDRGCCSAATSGRPCAPSPWRSARRSRPSPFRLDAGDAASAGFAPAIPTPGMGFDRMIRTRTAGQVAAMIPTASAAVLGDHRGRRQPRTPRAAVAFRDSEASTGRREAALSISGRHRRWLSPNARFPPSWTGAVGARLSRTAERRRADQEGSRAARSAGERIERVFAPGGFRSIGKQDLRNRMRWWGLYTQRKQGVPGERTGSAEPEELEDEFFMMRTGSTAGGHRRSAPRDRLGERDARARYRGCDGQAERAAPLDPDRGRPRDRGAWRLPASRPPKPAGIHHA